MRIAVIAAALASAALVSNAAEARVAHPECASLLPSVSLPPGQRALAPEDLAALRDIGSTEPQAFEAPALAISPDGRWAAFQLRQAVPESNSYCLAMVILDLSRKVSPRIVDEGGEPLLSMTEIHGIAETPSGWLKIITPRWSGDGTWIAFLKRQGGTTQVWRAFADGSGSAPLTSATTDVNDFRVAADGRSIIYATLPGIEHQATVAQKEALNGWHYDDRFDPMLSKRPLPIIPVRREVDVLDPSSGMVRPATPAEARAIEPGSDASLIVPAPARDTAGLEISTTNIFGLAPVGAFHARRADGSAATCTAPSCEGATHPWWMPGKIRIRFLRREGWASASTAIYEWDLRTGGVRRLYTTDDVLSSCTPQGTSLVCLIYSSLVPGQLVRLDPVSGGRKLLFDPNPEFAHLALGKAMRLHWHNAFGIESLADLVLPVGYEPGVRYPMIVVQYDTRGFLRGGTGDEYPIQAFANRGYAVLSFRRPEITAQYRTASTAEQVGRVDLAQFADRKSVQSSLEGGVRIAIERGIADPKRIGITGLSDGSSTAEWALIHSSLFAAAALSSCCWDPYFVAWMGPLPARHFRAEGWPGVLESSAPFWKEVSLLGNARRISTPILVSASKSEMLGAVASYTGLREAHVPIDMFVYPGEFHGRWQPAHRLANYRRSLDWFDYWLRGMRSDAPDRQPELKHWDELKKEARTRGGNEVG